MGDAICSYHSPICVLSFPLAFPVKGSCQKNFALRSRALAIHFPKTENSLRYRKKHANVVERGENSLPHPPLKLILSFPPVFQLKETKNTSPPPRPPPPTALL